MAFDLASIVEKQVQEQVQKVLAKKKNEDSDDESGSLAAFNLKDFDYEEMENLKIEGDEVSC